MQWQDIREHYPNQWLLIEAVNARTEEDRRIVENVAIVEKFEDSVTARARYRELHHQEPMREYYVVNTVRPELDITERRWLGIRF